MTVDPPPDGAGTPFLRLPKLDVPRTAPPRSAVARWAQSRPVEDAPHDHDDAKPWYQVLWLTGVDYFSTLGYQPGIALLAAGALAPVATAIVVLVTLACAVPVYASVAARSYVGQGSIAMLEHMLTGWPSKLVVLILLGFAGTDFIITATLSAADAAKHAVENPLLMPFLGHAQLGLTLGFLALLAAVFLRGFREAIGIAAAIAIPYVALNAIVIGRGFVELAREPGHLVRWTDALAQAGDWKAILLVSVLVFPKLALGLSGFETGVSVMPLVRGAPDDARGPAPVGRIAATRKLLLAAALIMSVMLLSSSVVTATLVPPEAYREGGPAAGRAIAWLAHAYLGHGFGTVYDLATIAILWFAGASAMAGLLNLVPRYLPRFGMAPRWTAYARPLVLVLFAIMAIVTLVFDAGVEAQAGAYATGVLVLMLSAACAVCLTFWREARHHPPRLRLRGRLVSAGFAVVSGIFAFTLIDNVHERPDGLIISFVFVTAIVLLGALSRYRRSTELRVAGIDVEDAESARLWPMLVGKKVNLVPLRTSTAAARRAKREELRRHYASRDPIAFVHVSLADNRSEFLANLRLSIRVEEDGYVVEVKGAVAIANTIAYLSELMDPVGLFLGLTRQNLTGQAFKYLLWGEGEIGLMVYSILVRYWEWTPEDDVRPLIFLMSE